VANEKERMKKAKAKKVGTYKDSKFNLPDKWSSRDDGWSIQTDLGWSGPYDKGSEEIEEHPYQHVGY
jgi:hypothetical protein